MTSQRLIGSLGVLAVTGALALALPGCGGGASTTGPNTQGTQITPPVNPAPGTLPIEEAYKSQQKKK